MIGLVPWWSSPRFERSVSALSISANLPFWGNWSTGRRNIGTKRLKVIVGYSWKYLASGPLLLASSMLHLYCWIFPLGIDDLLSNSCHATHGREQRQRFPLMLSSPVSGICMNRGRLSVPVWRLFGGSLFRLFARVVIIPVGRMASWVYLSVDLLPDGRRSLVELLVSFFSFPSAVHSLSCPAARFFP